MKKIIITLSMAICILSLSSVHAQSMQNEKLLRHVVLFKFKDNATSAQVKVIEDAFRELAVKIKLIKGFEWGVNNSPEKVNQGLTHCFFVTFTSEKDRDAYLVHPDHVAFTKIAGPQIDKVTVVDYWAGK